jgi:L-ascorbate metabolism protein UlaG (beta-lactamase superfamily)
MDIYWGGQALFRLKGKSAAAVIDPFDPAIVGLKLPKDLEADVVLKTHDHPDHNFLSAVSGNPLQITGPGEYEIKGIAIEGISVFHDTKKGEERGRNTIYNIEIDGLNIVHLGDLGHVLSEDQVQEVGNVDILMVPVGGTFTIDAKAASEVVSQLEPKIILPMHYGIAGLKFELETVDKFLKEMGVENPTPMAKLSITKDKLPEEPMVVILNKV